MLWMPGQPAAVGLRVGSSSTQFALAWHSVPTLKVVGLSGEGAQTTSLRGKT